MASAVPAWSLFSPMNVLKVELHIVDDAGRPVSYATVGSVWVPNGEPKHGDLNADDLWHILMRNPSAWEYWNSYVKPYPVLKYRGMTDQNGILADKIDYTGSVGVDSHFKPIPRPEVLTISYAVYKSGYEPAQQTVVAKKDIDSLSVNVVLRRTKETVSEEKSYLRALNEVRFEISDWHANEGMSQKNLNRLEGLRHRLEEAGDAAIAANDQRAAAHIFYWVAHMPEVSEINGKIVGYSQTNEKSPRNTAALRKAAELDSTNYQVCSQWLALEENLINRDHNQFNRTNEAEWTKQREDWLRRAEELDKVAGDTLWPNMHAFIANGYGYLCWVASKEKRYKAALQYCQKEYDKVLWIQEHYPKWLDNSKSIPVLIEKIDRYKKLAKPKPGSE